MAWINLTRHNPRLLIVSALAGIALSSLIIFSEDAGAQVGQAVNAHPGLSDEQVAWIGEQVFTNECNHKPACLTAWNPGENFPSLGIGHFIWYRQGQDDIFEQSFPALMHFMQDRGVAIPAWIAAANYASPWPDRDAFLADMDTPRLQELRRFLATHMTEQTAFIIARFGNALEAILDSETDAAASAMISGNFYAVANSAPPHGLYALIDYVNFKGTGVAPRETYAGQGWGLKQVLVDMGDMTASRGDDALAAFIESARRILARRVNNAPADRNEARWLAGWNNRLQTYAPPSRQEAELQ